MLLSSLFVLFRSLSCVLLLRISGFRDLDELPSVLKPWFVDPFYLDGFTSVWSEFFQGDELVSVTLWVSLQQERWSCSVILTV